ncbi:serine/arginine repetitive matrix protein 1 isoform X1 [Astyanax mexicanus]|uniref:serine/arginine repetitive matrix protein 1 isoform X1 n=1 Tax=Astyanax mexicanus TaxID=7994 RepID=UPI0020CAA51D|nr:serine/arginine repetitive matrix protein 1 isoform X1 [Astyanax mexicanus]
MVRPRSGSPRSKPRPYSDSYHSEHHGERFGPSSRSPRGFRGPSGKAPPSWQENNSGGPHPYNKRPPLMGEPRERHWMSHNQDNFRPYAGSQDSQRGRRRPSPPRSNRPPPLQHRMSPHSPSHGPPGQHRPSFRGNHVSSSPRHFHGPPSDRRGPSPNSNFRPPQRHRSPAQEQERSWGPERSFNRPVRGGHRWNGPGGYNHPNGQARFSGSPQRKPREFHERSSYPERWSAERDPRKQHGELGRPRGRERPGHHSPDWAHREGCNPHHNRPPFRSPSWKAGPPPSSSGSSSRFHPPPPLRPQDRPPMRPLKRLGHPPLSADVEHGPPKRFRRELSIRPLPPRGFGGRGLSLKDKSRLLKGRKFREESVARFKMPPPRPRPSDKVQKAKEPKTQRESKEEEEEEDADEVEESSSTGASSRSKVPLKKSVKRPGPRKLQPSEMDSKSADPERNAETQVESRRSVRAHSSSPIERQLTRDLVVVSHWEAGARPSSSPKDGSHWRNKPTKSKIDNSSSRDSSLTLSERFGKLHNLGSSPHAQEVERRLSDGPEKTFRKPVPFQKPGLRPSLGFKKGPCPDGVFRRPLMATIIPRPPLHQKPVFRKSQSIMSKYRNLQTLRHKAPPHPRQATSYRRW